MTFSISSSLPGRGSIFTAEVKALGKLCRKTLNVDQKQADFRMVASILTIVSGALLIPWALAKPFMRLVSSHGPAARGGRCYNYIPLSRAFSCFFLHDMGDTGLLSTRPTPGSPWIPGTPLRYPVSVRLTVWTINFPSFPSFPSFPHSPHSLISLISMLGGWISKTLGVRGPF